MVSAGKIKVKSKFDHAKNNLPKLQNSPRNRKKLVAGARLEVFRRAGAGVVPAPGDSQAEPS